MRHHLHKLNDEVCNKLNLKNGFRLKIGIGISTGRVFSGILGSLRIKEFISIGMPVNIAARLQGMARGGETLPSAKVKGINEPIIVYRVRI